MSLYSEMLKIKTASRSQRLQHYFDPVACASLPIMRCGVYASRYKKNGNSMYVFECMYLCVCICVHVFGYMYLYVCIGIFVFVCVHGYAVGGVVVVCIKVLCVYVCGYMCAFLDPLY